MKMLTMTMMIKTMTTVISIVDLGDERNVDGGYTLIGFNV